MGGLKKVQHQAAYKTLDFFSILAITVENFNQLDKISEVASLEAMGPHITC